MKKDQIIANPKLLLFVKMIYILEAVGVKMHLDTPTVGNLTGCSNWMHLRIPQPSVIYYPCGPASRKGPKMLAVF